MNLKFDALKRRQFYTVKNYYDNIGVEYEPRVRGVVQPDSHPDRQTVADIFVWPDVSI